MILRGFYRLYFAINILGASGIIVRMWLSPNTTHGPLVFIAALIWMFPALVVLLLRFWNPPASIYMLQTKWRIRRNKDGRDFLHNWVPFHDISPEVILAAIVAEDIYFLIHAGFDWESMYQAFTANKTGQRKRGGSTITQQVAKNLFLWPSRSYLRKLIEAYFTVLLEGCWPKKRILEIYLNIAQFSETVFGIQAAAQTFFGKSAKLLPREEAALITAVLPNPLIFHPDNPSHYVRFRQMMILTAMKKSGPKLWNRMQSINT